MPQHFVETFVGVQPADAEQIEVSYSRETLVLRYIDWREEPQSVEFPETLAFRWQEQDDVATPRDDMTYQVMNSQWLASQVSGMPGSDGYVHYKLCFNACGVLDIICKEIQKP